MDTFTVGNSLAGRATSAFPLSIGTSLAFESVFTPLQTPYDPNRQIPDHLSPLDYDNCWINAVTLFRNLSSAVTKDVFLTAKASAITDVLEMEMEVIENLFSTEGKNVCKPTFYFSTYSKLKSSHIPGVSFREPSTDGQKYYEYMLKQTLDVLNKRSEAIRVFDDAIKPASRERSFVLTHFPYDLIGYEKFDRFDLLESNTGVVKPRPRWNSKYCPMAGQSFDQLPFFRKLLVIFGDKTLIKPFPAVLRKQILDTSIKRNWTPMTTRSKVMFDLELDIQDPYAISVIRSID